LLYELIENDFGRSLRSELKKHIMLRGCTGDCSDVEIQGERAIISYLYASKGENASFEMNKHHLLELINKWEDVSNRDAKEIIVRRDGERFEIESMFE
jgi:hypothetical protein